MKREEGNIEDFLREKLSHGEEGFTNDWSDFEQKLERATFFKQLRVGAVASVLLIVFSVSFFGGSSFRVFGPSISNKAKEILYYGTGSHSEFTKLEEADETVSESVVAAQGANNAMKENQVVASKDESAEVMADQSAGTGKAEATEVKADLAVVEKSEDNSVASVSESNEKPKEEIVADEAAVSVASALVSQENVEAGNLSAEVEPVIAEEPAPEIDNEPTFGSLAGAEAAAGVANRGFSLVPDGRSGSNFKPNVKPTELMFDMRDVANLELRSPVVPPSLKEGKPKEAYVSPLQEKRPWSYSIKVYPNYTYRKFVVAPDKMAYIHRDFVDQVKVSESGGFSLNVGFEASKRIGRITYLNLGVEYISYKTEAEFDFINYRDAVINSQTGEIQSYHIRNEPEHILIQDDNRYHYLNFPLSIAYKPWVTDHVRINIEGGASYMYFIKASGKSLDYQTLEIIDISEREYRKNIGSIFMKVGATYHVSEQFSVGFEPTVVYFTNTIYSEKYPFEVIPYSMGMNFKVQMKLN